MRLTADQLTADPQDSTGHRPQPRLQRMTGVYGFVLLMLCTVSICGCNQNRYQPAEWRAKVDSTIPGITAGDQPQEATTEYRSADSYFSGGSAGSTLPGRGGTLPFRAGTLPSRAGTLPARGATLPARSGTLPARGGMTPGRIYSDSTLPARDLLLPARDYSRPIGNSLPAGVGSATTMPWRAGNGVPDNLELPGRLSGSTLPQRGVYPGGRLEQLPPIRSGSTLPR